MVRGGASIALLLALVMTGAAPPPAIPALVTPAHPQVSDFHLTGRAVQGGLVHGRVPPGTRDLTFNGQPVSVAPDGAFIIAFDRNAPARAELDARLPDGRLVRDSFPVAPGDWLIENVDAAPLGGAHDDAEFKARRPGEIAQIVAARAAHADSDGWRQHFMWPVAARISGHFGAQRIYRGYPGAYHSGTDLAAPAGTVYVAPADGVVTLAADQPFTLEGRLVIIDHGMGLNSALLHASQLFVHVGEHVKQGEPIGRVGMSGRATGPHLHWGLEWNGARLDPEKVVALMAAKSLQGH